MPRVLIYKIELDKEYKKDLISLHALLIFILVRSFIDTIELEFK